MRLNSLTRLLPVLGVVLILSSETRATETAPPDYRVTYTAEGNLVTVKLENLGRQCKIAHFDAGVPTNLRLVGISPSVVKACNPGVTPLMQFTKINPDQPIQLAYQCNVEVPQNATPISPAKMSALPFGAHTPSSLVAHAVIQPSPLLGPTPLPAQPLDSAPAPHATPALPTPDLKFAYHLPFAAGERYTVIQGYHGQFTHQKEDALDFGMPLGTPIRAVRDGEVSVVISKFHDHEGGMDGLKYGASCNEIEIDHADGTTAFYRHMKHDGVTVSLHQKVKAGDIIGYVGMTGATTCPHLHVEIVDTYSRKDMKTLFRTATAPEGVELQERDCPTAL